MDECDERLRARWRDAVLDAYRREAFDEIAALAHWQASYPHVGPPERAPLASVRGVPAANDPSEGI